MCADAPTQILKMMEGNHFCLDGGNHTMNEKLFVLKSRRLLVNDLYRLACLLEIVLHVDL